MAISSVLQTNSVLESLDISGNKDNSHRLTQSTASSVMTHFSRTIALTETLKHLKMTRMGITDWIIVDHLADALSRNRSLLTLDLSSNRIGQDGGIQLAHALEHNMILAELKLSHCSIQEAGAKGMMKMLTRNTTLRR